MARIDELIDAFENRDSRIESDCAIISMIFEEFRTEQEKEGCEKIAAWILDLLETKKSNVLAKQIAINKLWKNRRRLSPELRTRFRHIIKKLKKSRKLTKKWLFL